MISRTQRPEREWLNSERIAARFGNYTLEVLEATDSRRVSCLRSTTQGLATCRTFAVVHYPPVSDPAVAYEQALILSGGSIAAVFAAHGWAVRKTDHCYSERPATVQLAELMAISVGALLAEHSYVLSVAKEGRVVEYARIVETHHPDYLSRDDVIAIYGRTGSDSQLARHPRSTVTRAAFTTARPWKHCGNRSSTTLREVARVRRCDGDGLEAAFTVTREIR